MSKYILSIDQGTTGTTVLLINFENFHLTDKLNIEFKQIYPHPGHVEHDLVDIWQTIEILIPQILHKNKIQGNQIIAIGITNQRETICAFDKQGRPLANAIVWQDRRTSHYCERLIKEGHEQFIRNKTGLPIDPYFSASKINWLLNNDKNVQTALKEKNLLFGTIDTYLLSRLTDQNVFATEATNASRTLLCNIITGNWDTELLKIFGIPAETLPEIKDSFTFFGNTQNLSFLPDGIPITGILGDQQSALLGQAITQRGQIKCTYGTGAFMLMNTGQQLERSLHGLISTIAYRHNGVNVYALEGSCYIAGAAVQWLRDSIKIINKSSDVEKLALKVKNMHEMEHLLFLPFFTGIGSPYWKAEAKATITGITRDTSSAHIARATLDGIAFSINDLLQSFLKNGSLSGNSLRVDGGAVENNLLMQIQADVSHIKIVRPRIIETTGFGAAIAAGIGLGSLQLDHISEFWNAEKTFTPNEQMKDFYLNKYEQWSKTIQKFY